LGRVPARQRVTRRSKRTTVRETRPQMKTKKGIRAGILGAMRPMQALRPPRISAKEVVNVVM
jgi:hypothetical protein